MPSGSSGLSKISSLFVHTPTSSVRPLRDSHMSCRFMVTLSLLKTNYSLTQSIYAHTRVTHTEYIDAQNASRFELCNTQRRYLSHKHLILTKASTSYVLQLISLDRLVHFEITSPTYTVHSVKLQRNFKCFRATIWHNRKPKIVKCATTSVEYKKRK